MAYTYTRDRSPFIWIRFKTKDGKWKAAKTSYRKGHKVEIQKAESLAAAKSKEEREHERVYSERWESWVPVWIEETYGDRPSTAVNYRRYWRQLFAWLTANSIGTALQLDYNGVLKYMADRTKKVSRNMAIHELKFLGVVQGQAVKRGLASVNPCLRMGFRRTKPAEKSVWTDEELKTVSEALKTGELWMRATFVLGIYQAARLRQCAVPIADIDLDRQRITYRTTKGDKPFTQPIDPRAIPEIRAIIAARAGHKTLCDIPEVPSVCWREFLDQFGYRHLSHHGLRVTWITRAAKSGKITLSQAKAFVNHSSTAVHAVYQKFNADDLSALPALLDLPQW